MNYNNNNNNMKKMIPRSTLHSVLVVVIFNPHKRINSSIKSNRRGLLLSLCICVCMCVNSIVRATKCIKIEVNLDD